MPNSAKSSDGVAEDDGEAPKTQQYLFNGIWDTTCFGLFLKWFGFVAVWHIPLFTGIREFFIGFCIFTVGYAALILSLAEMVSVIAYPGGYYGYARCAVHPFFGYLVGCSGIIENVMMIASCVSAITELITLIFETSVDLQPMWWVLIHLTAIVAQVQKRTVYWYMMVSMSFISLCICCIYFFGGIPKYNFNDNVTIAHTKVDRSLMMQYLFFHALFYSGTDLMVITSFEVKDSKRVVPRAMVLTFILLVLLAIATIFCTISQPGLKTYAIFYNAYAWTLGFSELFNVDMQYAGAYALIPIFSSMFGYMFVGGRGIRSMATSGLLPRVLASERTFTTIKAPLAAMCSISAVAIAIQYIARKYPETGISVLLIFYGAFIGYLCMFVCYVVFKIRYSNLARTFTSVLGIPGAVIGFGAFVIGIVSLNTFPDHRLSVYAYVTWMGLFIIYYVLYGERNQTFAPSEQHEFFKIYLINMNRRRRLGVIRSKYLFVKSLFCGYDNKPGRVLPRVEMNYGDYGSVSSHKNDHTVRTASLEEVPEQHKHVLVAPPIFEAEESDDL